MKTISLHEAYGLLYKAKKDIGNIYEGFVRKSAYDLEQKLDDYIVLKKVITTAEKTSVISRYIERLEELKIEEDFYSPDKLPLYYKENISKEEKAYAKAKHEEVCNDIKYMKQRLAEAKKSVFVEL